MKITPAKHHWWTPGDRSPVSGESIRNPSFDTWSLFDVELLQNLPQTSLSSNNFNQICLLIGSDPPACRNWSIFCRLSIPDSLAGNVKFWVNLNIKNFWDKATDFIKQGWMDAAAMRRLVHWHVCSNAPVAQFRAQKVQADVQPCSQAWNIRPLWLLLPPVSAHFLRYVHVSGLNGPFGTLRFPIQKSGVHVLAAPSKCLKWK